MMKNTYTIFDFQKDFPNDKACLEYIFNKQYPDGYVDKKTGEVKEVYFIESRKCFATADGEKQIYPTAGIIFHKSRTPLVKWFYVIFRMTQSKCGISAKQIEREIGVTYKTAWRMCKLIREALECEDGSLFEGVIETDETYYGDSPRKSHRNPTTPKKTTSGKRGRGTDKMPIIGVVERSGCERR